MKKIICKKEDRDMVSQEVIQTTITNYFAVNNALDVERFVNAFAADAAMYNVAEISPITGYDAIRQAAQQMLTPYSELNATINRVFISGDGAAVFYTAYLTAKNGRTATVEGIDVFEINSEGKIQTIRYYVDPTPVLALFS
jgi:steroid delta-isomerase